VDTKRLAGRHAADFVTSGMVLGLGTGSTVFFALERLSERIREEQLDIRGVPTSNDTATKAGELGIALTTLAADDRLDLTIDGADEVDRNKNLIKGGGGALLREKVVAAASKEMVVIVGETKLVDELGRDFLLPVEVVSFAVPTVTIALRELGCQAFLRTGKDASPFVTDNGNQILDCRFPGIPEPAELEIRINMIPGVVENGLFIGLAGRVVVGQEDGSVRVI